MVNHPGCHAEHMGMAVSRATVCDATGALAYTFLDGEAHALRAHQGLTHGMRQKPFTEHAIRYSFVAPKRSVYVRDYMRRIGLALGADPSASVTILKGFISSACI